jgi:hypothetical protein
MKLTHHWWYADHTLETCDLLRFEVLTAVKITMLFFWIVTQCGLGVTTQNNIECDLLVASFLSTSEKNVLNKIR